MENWRLLLFFLAISISGNNHAEETSTPQEITAKDSAPPAITAVKPSPVPGTQQRQWIKLIGEDFTPALKATLRLGEQVFPIPPERTKSISSKALEIYVNVSTGPATWQAQVSNPKGQNSKPFSFEVKPPALIAPEKQEELEEQGKTAEIEVLEKKAEETNRKIDQAKETAEKAKLEAVNATAEKAAVQQKAEKTTQAARTSQQLLENAKAKAQATGNSSGQKGIARLAEEAEKREQAAATDKNKLAAIEAKEQTAKEKATATETEIEELRKEFAELRKQRAGKRTFLEQSITAAWVILVGFIVWFIKRLAVNKFESITVKREEVREGSARLRTLVLLLNWLGTILIILTIGYLILDEFGINMAPILASLGIAGLALGFGGQYLIRDLISGIFILVEGQYNINDIVQIGEFSGMVEVVNLRHTQLRDLGGQAIYIPNGEIKAVVNFTKGYGQILLDIRIAYKENVDHVIEVMKKVVEEMRQTAACARFIKDFEMFGVEDFGESGVTIRCRFKTRAGKQWEIAREYRRRLKNCFDELGIEIPFPHRTLNWKTPSQNHRAEEFEHTKSAIIS